jgi:tripartite-type tricarboxylate transporter receptor subunit TctC
MRARGIALVALATLLAAGSATAQTSYPDKAVRILVGFTPGTAPDVTSRVIADKFAEAWGKPVVVENVTGAGGNIACDRVAKAQPDGYTLVMCGNGSLVIAPSLYERLPFDPLKDFTPITQVFVAANVLVVHPDVPAKSLQELIALMKAQPGKLTYGHAGAGTSQHLAGELFKSMAKVDIQPVAYRGTTALLPDLLAGRLHIFFGNISNVLPLIRDGKLRAFAVTSAKRSSAIPELPTLSESGFPGFEAVPWFGLMGPAGTPQAVVEKVHRETARVLAMPDVRKRFDDIGIAAIGGTPAEFSGLIKTELPVWAKVIKEAGIKLNE